MTTAILICSISAEHTPPCTSPSWAFNPGGWGAGLHPCLPHTHSLTSTQQRPAATVMLQLFCHLWLTGNERAVAIRWITQLLRISVQKFPPSLVIFVQAWAACARGRLPRIKGVKPAELTWVSIQRLSNKSAPPYRYNRLLSTQMMPQ